jgi:hypothetical protein
VIGEEPIDLGGGAWFRGLVRLTLDGQAVELRQQQWVVHGTSWSDLRGEWRYTTDLYVDGVTEAARDGVIQICERLAELLGFATASEVVVFGWEHAAGSPVAYKRSTLGEINYFIPVVNTRDGDAVRLFVERTWAGFVRERDRRKLPAVFHYLALAEREGTPLELKLAILFIVLEQLKHSFAVSNGYVFIRPRSHVPGTATPTRGSGRGFEALLREMFAAAGMAPALSTVVELRNEILHSGLSDRPFRELATIRGDTLMLIREYLLRLLGYSGVFFTGQEGGVDATIT